MATQQRKNTRKLSPEKNERSPVRHALRRAAIVLALQALGASILLAVSHSQNPWLTILAPLFAVLAGLLSIIFSLFSWLSSSSLPTNSSEAPSSIIHSSDTQPQPSRTDRTELESKHSIEIEESRFPMLGEPSTGKSTDSVQKDNKTKPSYDPGKYNVQITGNVQGFAQGDHQTVNMKFGKPPQEEYEPPRQSSSNKRDHSQVSPYQSTLFPEQRGRGKLTRDFSSPIFLVNEQLPAPHGFYGRKKELGELLMCIVKESSASIVGPEYIGKTWLIEYLCQIASTNLEKRVSISYIDAALPACDTVTGFAQEALKAFGYRSLSEHSSPNLALLGKYVHSLQEKQLVILCIDNFDAFTQRKEFDRSFFEAVRAMAQRDLCLVAASKKPLIDLVSKSTGRTPLSGGRRSH